MSIGLKVVYIAAMVNLLGFYRKGSVGYIYPKFRTFGWTSKTSYEEYR